MIKSLLFWRYLWSPGPGYVFPSSDSTPCRGCPGSGSWKSPRAWGSLSARTPFYYEPSPLFYKNQKKSEIFTFLLGNSNLQSSHSMFFQDSDLQQSLDCFICILLASQNCRHFTWMNFMVPEHLHGLIKGLSSSGFFAFSRLSQFFKDCWEMLLLSERQMRHCFTDVSHSSSLSPWSDNVCLSRYEVFWVFICLLFRKISRILKVIRPSLMKSFEESWKPCFF